MSTYGFANPTKVQGDVQALPLGSQVVTALQGRPVSRTPPSPSQALVWSGSTNSWVPTTIPGTAISFNTITANVNITGTSAGTATTVISSTTKTFDGTQAILEFFSPAVSTPSAAAGNTTSLFLFESGTAITLLAQVLTPAAAITSVPVFVRYIFSPTAGSHQYVIGGVVSNTTGTPHVSAGTGTAGGTAPTYLRITEA
jgi:hypothetical protein